MRKAFSLILRLYPAEYRAAFGPEMVLTFQRAGMNGNSGKPSFLVRELTGALTGVATEWIAKWKLGSDYLIPVANLDAELPVDAVELRTRLSKLIRAMEHAIAHHDFPRARLYSDAERVTRMRLENLI
jgi:hypothetical protein